MRNPKYKYVFCGSMEKTIAPHQTRGCNIEGEFKTFKALEAAAHATLGWHLQKFDRIFSYRKQVSIERWEKANG